MTAPDRECAWDDGTATLTQALTRNSEGGRAREERIRVESAVGTAEYPIRNEPNTQFYCLCSVCEPGATPVLTW